MDNSLIKGEMTEAEYEDIALKFISVHGLPQEQVEFLFSDDCELSSREKILLAQINFLNARVMDAHEIFEVIASKISTSDSAELAQTYLENTAEKRSLKAKKD